MPERIRALLYSFAMVKDLFSTQAEDYAKYRPTYPPELFEFLAALAPGRDRALDCATGNGQAARALAAYFDRVDAIDLSETQIAAAASDPKVVYAVARAEATGYPDRSFDLVTVAQAYHWFDFPAFEAELRRIAKAGGILAVWGYLLSGCEDPEVDRLVKSYREKVGAYWDPEHKMVEQGYATVPFSYQELPSPKFMSSVSWNRNELLGYLSTSSALQHYRKAEGLDPIAELRPELEKIWQEDVKRFEFPIFLRVGRIL